jgi:hypothetical protein
MNRHIRNVIRAAEREGVTKISVDMTQNAKHGRLRGIYEGKPFEMIVCKGTGHGEVVSVRNYIRRTTRRMEELQRRHSNRV